VKKFPKYEDCLKFLFEIERTGIKYNLLNIKLLLDFLGNPQYYFHSVHIAGTNGKGSVASIINSILIERNLTLNKNPDNEHVNLKKPFADSNIGLYTSPHISDFRERILVNGVYIFKEYIVDFINRIYNFIKSKDVSFFEVTTALAFEYFKFRKVGFAIIEAGLGGRLDSTNILKPVVTVITGISTDHTEYLGNSLKSIAIEKAGIIKRNTPCIIGDVNVRLKNIILKAASKKNSEIIYQKKRVSVNSRNFKGFIFNSTYHNEKLKRFNFPVIGDYQAKNISTALRVLEVLEKKTGLKFSNTVLRSGFKNILVNSKLYGRFQVLKTRPKIILDVSHNSEALLNIKDSLKYIRYKNLFIIFGIMKDKNYRECLKIIESLKGFVILTRADYKRALEPQILFQYIKKLNNFVLIKNIGDSYDFVEKIIKKNDLLLVTGSFFVAGDFLKASKLKLEN